ncbi:MAG TPA: BTAD domain-containing putative transcriptional regulator, partial [Chloroflexota bacterium]|nr:BTAD domain-containing putative transcriptional regulator [Chloroflexota bacterium]
PAPPADEEPGRPPDPAPDQHGPSAPTGAGAADSAGAAPSVTIEIRCFGGFEVHCGQRRLSATGNAGPRHRSWEILAFLAAQPAELVATDKLLAAMWPESDADKAASAFGAALSRLRRLLADQLGESPGPVVHRDRVGRTCRLDPLVFVSDVHRFVRLSREARRMPAEEAISAYEQARRLYQGDLLRDQPYAWLHERDDDGLTLPERHRETYRLITYELAELYLQSGQVERAVPLYKSLLKAEPTLEDVARRLYRCYGLLGDRVSLLREHRQLQQALREAYGPEDDEDEAAEAHDPQTEAWLASPEPETIAVYEAVLATLDQQHAGASGQPNGTAAAPDGTSGASGATGARGHDGGAVPYANGVAAPATHAAHRPRGESTPDPAGPAGTGQVMDPLSRPARTET